MQTPPTAAQRGDEIFDIVNERDEVIGQATRREVHARKLWHRAIHVLVFSEAGRVFLQKRSLAKDTAPGCWDSSCSGHLDTGEDYAMAAVRELQEEIGVSVPSPAALSPVLRLTPCAETGWEFVWVYTLRYDGPFVLNPAEITEGAWFTRLELAERLRAEPDTFARSFRYLWEKFAAANPARGAV